MIELRWVEFGPNRQLEFRARTIRVDNWGNVRGLDNWSNWTIVPTISGDDTAMQDLIASGGIAGAP